MKVKPTILIASLVFSTAFGQIRTNSEEVRKIRLDNFKDNYKGQVIRFTNGKSKIIEGVLMDVTDSDFIISINNSAAFYSHKDIDTVSLPPVLEDFYMVTGVSVLGGLAGYAAMIITHPNPKNGSLGAVSTIGIFLGYFLGKKTFYKPQKIDISGRLRG